MSRLVLVEGIPGSGKTTTARRLAELLGAGDRRVQVFLEGEAQPTDLAWQWWISQADFAALLSEWPAAADTLVASAWEGRAGVAVAYNQLDRGRFDGGWDMLADRMAAREPFNGTVTGEQFVGILAQRWAEFGDDEAERPGYVVFESALLQNVLGELILFAKWGQESIAQAVAALLEGVSALNPVVVRLVTADVTQTIVAAAAERTDDLGGRWWQAAYREFMSATPWAIARELAGDDAMFAYLRERTEMESRLAGQLLVDWLDLPSPAGTSQSWSGLDRGLVSVAEKLRQP